MITGDHDLHQTRWDIPTLFECIPISSYGHSIMAFSTLNARSPLFEGTTRNLSLAPSKMLRHLCPFTETTR